MTTPRKTVPTLGRYMQPLPEPGKTWYRDAECARRHSDGSSVYDPDLFFPMSETGPSELQAKEAVSICRACPVVEICLANAPAFGVWGATTEHERTRAKRREAVRRQKLARMEAS